MAQHTPSESQLAVSAKLRNEPVQARSTARLTRLLDAAAEVIDEIGFERLTTAMVAERAGASIGTVYRYFPDRIAVLQSLSARSTAEYIDEVGAVVRDRAHGDWPAAFDAALDLLHESFRSKSGFRSLRFGDVIDLKREDGSGSNGAVVAEAISSVFASRFGLDASDAAFHVDAALIIADALFARSYSMASAGDDRYSAVAKSMAHDYLVQKLGAST